MKNMSGIRALGKNAPRTEKPEARCQFCGDVILGKARLKSAPRKFCSQSCSAKAQVETGWANMRGIMGGDA